MKKRLIALVLALLLTLPALSALADEPAVITGRTAVYASANTSSKQLGVLGKGREVTLKAEKGSWARIELNGRIGYVPVSSLKKSAAETGQIRYVSADKAKVYLSASASSAVLGTLAYGAKVTLLLEKGGWARISNGTQTGYIASSSLTKQKPAETVAMYVKTVSLPVYASPKTSSSRIGTLKYGAEVKAVKTKGGWTQLRSGSRLGYVKASSLTKEKPYAKTAYINAETAKIYKKANTSSAVLGKVGLNTKLTVTAVSSDRKWARVIWNGKTGYCGYSVLGASKVALYATLSAGDSGTAVTRLQERLGKLGYYYGAINGKYTAMTTAAVKLFQQKAKLSDSGIADDETQKALYAATAPKADAVKKVKSTAVPAKGPSVLSDWFTGGIASVFKKGAIAVLTDVNTGLSFRIYCAGGKNHPNCMPYSKDDTVVMFAASSNQWDWTRRPCWISIDGVRYAASYTSMPEGDESLNGNGYNGTFCVHFPGSKTTGTDAVCELHQAAIKAALKAG